MQSGALSVTLALLLACGLVLAPLKARAVLLALHDQREYNASVSLPLSTVTDAFPPLPPPTTVLVARFAVPLAARNCNDLTVDVGLLRVVGANARTPQFISAWLWRVPTLDNQAFAAVAPLWSGNLTMPASLARPGLARGAYVETHRLQLPRFTTALWISPDYWLGLSVGVDRAYDAATNSANEVRWLAASTAIPSPRMTQGAPYKAIDRFSNGASLRHPELRFWQNASVAEPWLVAPTGAASGTQRLALFVAGDCAGTSAALLPLGLPEPYAAPTPAPAQSPSLSPVPVPTLAPVAEQASPSPTRAQPEPSPSPTRAQPESSPSPTRPRPEPSPSPTRAEPEPSPAPTADAPADSPASAPSGATVPSAAAAPVSPPDSAVVMSPTTLIVLFALIGLVVLALIGAVLFFWSRRLATHLGYKRTLVRNDQEEFNQLEDLATRTAAWDAANIPLESMRRDDGSRSGSRSGSASGGADKDGANTSDDASSLLVDDDDDVADAPEPPIPPSPYYSDEERERRRMTEITLTRAADPSPSSGSHGKAAGKRKGQGNGKKSSE